MSKSSLLPLQGIARVGVEKPDCAFEEFLLQNVEEVVFAGHIVVV